MGIDVNNLTEEQENYVQSYKRINRRLETLQNQMKVIQYETKELLTELEELRKKENKKLEDGEK
jgi:septation ring formation regulator EzrA